MKKNAFLLILFAMGIFSVFSQVPKTLSYQGNVSDATGPLNGTYALTFRIYDAATGGGMLWSETNSAVPIVNGNLSIILGKIVPVNIEANISLWMGITIAANPEISPRVELTGSLYALGMALPFKSKSLLPTSLFSIEATGDGARAGEFIHSGANSGQVALSAISTGGNLAFQAWNSGNSEKSAFFYSSSPTSQTPNVGVLSLGLGKGLDVSLTNVSNSNAAIFINHAGTGNAITANRPIQATQFIGDGSLLSGVQGLRLPFSQTIASATPAFEITNSSTSGSAARFNISNISSTAAALHIDNRGIGTGLAVQNFNSVSSSPVFDARTTGTGYAGIFTVANPESQNASAIRVVNSGLGGGGYFEANNPLGTGSPIVGQVSQGTGDVINASQLGTGSGLFVNILNASNSAPGIKINHSGTGNAITANRPIEATKFIGDGSLLTNLPANGLGSGTVAGNTPYWNGVSWEVNSNNIFNNGANVGIGTSVPAHKLDVNGNLRIGKPSVHSGGTATHEALIASNAGYNLVRLAYNGYEGGFWGNLYFGPAGPFATTSGSSHNIGIGGHSLQFLTTGTANIALGWTSLYSNTTGRENVAIGGQSVLRLNTTGNNNIAIGMLSMYSNTTGSNNTVLGYGAGYNPTNPANANTTGSNNTFIGYNAGPGTPEQLTNATAIGSNALVTSSNSLILGGTGASAVKVGIGITSPTTSLDVVGSVKATQFIGDGSLLSNLPSTGLVLPFAGSSATSLSSFSSSNTSTGGAGDFKITNSANPAAALHAETNGSGASFLAVNTGATGSSGVFQNTNPENNNASLRAISSGTAGGTAIEGVAINNGVAIKGFISTGNNGTAIQGENSGSGSAGTFRNRNSSNLNPALAAVTTGNGSAGTFSIQNSDNPNIGVAVQTNGLGSAGRFEISNTANRSPAILVSNEGSGNAIEANRAIHVNVVGLTGTAGSFQVNNPANNNSALSGSTTGVAAAVAGVNLGTSHAGEFLILNPSNTSSAVRASTNGTGTAIFANHTGSGGNIAIFQSFNGNRARIDKNGTGFFNGGVQGGGADVAEMFNVEGIKNEYEPGDVLVISEKTDRTVEKSSEANSTRIAGVYATKPGVILTERDIEENLDDLIPMGMVGVIPTKVCSQNGAIKRGDLLVTSSVPGYAMKAKPDEVNGVKIYPVGAILGKALENFDGASGVIKVLVNVK